jgi:hypothetical protein
MNRLSHLRATLPRNISDCEGAKGVEFVLLDYNSSDGLEDWVKEEMTSYLDSGLLRYFRTNEPTYFHRSHSRNVAFKLGRGRILCNVDADNYLGRGFVDFCLTVFREDQNIFLCSDASSPTDTLGRIAVWAQHFVYVRGYDERMENYGFEDIDFTNRLKLFGLKEITFKDEAFLRCVKHENRLRIMEEKDMRTVRKIYISYEDPLHSTLILLYADSRYEKFTVVDQANIYGDSDDYGRHYLAGNFPKFGMKENNLESGVWEERVGYLAMSNGSNDEVPYLLTQRSLLTDKFGRLYHPISNNILLERIMKFKSELMNHKILCDNLSKGLIAVNEHGFGQANVYLNFDQRRKIEVR